MVTIQSVVFERSRAFLLLDSSEKVCISRDDFLESGWHEGDTIERSVFDRFIHLHQFPRALNAAVAMLARRPCSKHEIRMNLNRKHFASEVVELVICKLEKEKLLNDREFSELWLNHRSEKYGSNRIRQELKHKGISSEILDETMLKLSEEEELSRATVQAKKSWSGMKNEHDRRKAKQKIISSLVRKGFRWDIARIACESAENSVDPER